MKLPFLPLPFLISYKEQFENWCICFKTENWPEWSEMNYWFMIVQQVMIPKCSHCELSLILPVETACTTVSVLLFQTVFRKQMFSPVEHVIGQKKNGNLVLQLLSVKEKYFVNSVWNSYWNLLNTFISMPFVLAIFHRDIFRLSTGPKVPICRMWNWCCKERKFPIAPLRAKNETTSAVSHFLGKAVYKWELVLIVCSRLLVNDGASRNYFWHTHWELSLWKLPEPTLLFSENRYSTMLSSQSNNLIGRVLTWHWNSSQFL